MKELLQELRLLCEADSDVRGALRAYDTEQNAETLTRLVTALDRSGNIPFKYIRDMNMYDASLAKELISSDKIQRRVRSLFVNIWTRCRDALDVAGIETSSNNVHIYQGMILGYDKYWLEATATSRHQHAIRVHTLGSGSNPHSTRLPMGGIHFEYRCVSPEVVRGDRIVINPGIIVNILEAGSAFGDEFNVEYARAGPALNPIHFGTDEMELIVEGSLAGISEVDRILNS